MPSPFPGMDPFIEAGGEWGDFHSNLLSAIRGSLNARLPPRFRAKTDVYVWIHEPSLRRRRRVEPDVFIKERPEQAKPSASTSALAAPATIVLPLVERARRKSIQVVDRRLHRVVTVIEALSPANKEAGDDRDAYLVKRNEYLANRLNLVEIDLLRGGPRLPLGHPAPEIDDYYVMVCRSWQYPKADIWTFSIRNSLPQVPIPLGPKMPEPLLPLRECVDRVYDEGSYQMELDYHLPLTPRLNKADIAWVRDLLLPKSSKKSC